MLTLHIWILTTVAAAVVLHHGQVFVLHQSDRAVGLDLHLVGHLQPQSQFPINYLDPPWHN